MTNKYILTLFIFLSAFSFMSAQDMETLNLKDGSILKGVMIEQEPGRNLLFYSDDVKVSKGLRVVAADIYEIPWKDVSYIEKEDKSDLLLSGTISQVIMKDGKSYAGFIKEIYPGLKIKLRDNVENKSVMLNYSDINTINTIKVNANQSLVEQFYYMDSIIMRNDRIAGFIVKQNIGKSITVLSDDTEIEINLGEIVKIKKNRNEDYRPIYDVVLQPGQFVYNNVDVIFQTIKPTQANLYIINTESSDIIDVYVGQTVSICANLVDKETTISAIKATTITENARLVGNKKNYYETFKMDDFVNSNIIVEKSEPTKIGTTKFSFTPYETGCYVLYVSNKEGFVIIRVNQ